MSARMPSLSVLGIAEGYENITTWTRVGKNNKVSYLDWAVVVGQGAQLMGEEDQEVEVVRVVRVLRVVLGQEEPPVLGVR